jgi:TetR/AcrR family transcriptional regulator, cholesterol catabolism regulator
VRKTSALRARLNRKPPAARRPQAGSGSGNTRGTFIDEASDRATALFLAHGYDNTPMSAIAKALSLTKAGVYHHFESKEDLLYAVHRRNLERRLLPILTAIERIAEPEARLRKFLFELALLMTRDPAARILITEARRLSPVRFAEIRGVWRRVYELFRDTIRSLQKNGRCRRDIDPGFAAFAAIGMCSWILFWFDYDRPETGKKVAATLCDIMMSGILMRADAHTTARKP